MTHGCASNPIKFLAAASGLTIILAACAPSSTYPPVETTARLTKPTFEPVPTVIATAIRYAQENYTKDQDVAINLPPGVPAAAYDKVFAKLGGGRPMMNPDEPAIHITEVRTRNFNAQVDMIYPRADGLNQFVTLSMKRSVLENYRVERARPWQLRDVASMAPNYVVPQVTADEPPIASDESSEAIVASPTEEESIQQQ
jgi:hypothetical protein